VFFARGQSDRRGAWLHQEDAEDTGRASRSGPAAHDRALKLPGVGRTFQPIMPHAAPRLDRGRARSQRLETRVTAEQKHLIERAAALQGRTITDFVLTSVQDAARRTIEEHQQLHLSVRDSKAFVEALLRPTAVNRRLRDTVRRYRAATGA